MSRGLNTFQMHRYSLPNVFKGEKFETDKILCFREIQRGVSVKAVCTVMNESEESTAESLRNMGEAERILYGASIFCEVYLVLVFIGLLWTVGFLIIY